MCRRVVQYRLSGGGCVFVIGVSMHPCFGYVWRSYHSALLWVSVRVFVLVAVFLVWWLCVYVVSGVFGFFLICGV